MNHPNPEHFLEELRFTIETKDKIKALAVLSYLGELSELDKACIFEALTPCDQDFCLWLLGTLAARGEKESKPLREKLLERLLVNPQACLRIIEEETEPATKVVFLEMAGELQLEEAGALLLPLLEQETDVRVLQAVLETLGTIGTHQAVPLINDFLYAGHQTLVQAAIAALEGINSPSALECLFERLGNSDDIDFLILDALSRIQDDRALEKLSEALKSHHASIRNHAKTHLAALGPKAVPVLIKRLEDPDPDLRIHTLNLLGTIGDLSAAPSIRKLLHTEPANANVRFAAFEALGLLPLSKGAYFLTDGLSDPIDHVRVAAARAMEKNFHPVLSAGLKNLVQDGVAAPRIVAALLEAEADRLVEALSEDASFRGLASELLENSHPDLQRHFASLLAPAREKDQRRLPVMAVDDSRMILSIYKNALFQIGYEPRLFEFPARALEALEKLEKEKPALLVTDLNMPEITGIELARKVRRIFSREELPILMVTTQGDLEDHAEAKEAGVDAIMLKPFTKETLKERIDSLLAARF